MLRVTKWGPPIDGIQLTLTSAQDVYAAAHAIALTMLLKNIGGRAAAVVSRSPWKDYEFSVTGVDGTPASPTLFASIVGGLPDGEVVRVELAPGAVVLSTVIVNRLFDMSRSGAYVVTASRRVTIDNGQPITVRSNSIGIAVAELAPEVGGDQLI